MLFCLAALIFRHRQNFSPRGFVFLDRADTLDRWPGPKSLRRASLRSRFLVRPSCMLQEERPLASRISRLILTLSSHGSTARAEIAPPRRPKGPILNLGLLCCWRGAFFSVDILASTSPLCAYMYEKFVFDKIHEKLDWFLEN